MPSTTTSEHLERRAYWGRAASLRAEGDEREFRFEGHAIVFNLMSEDLGFREVIRPEAVDRTLREALDVRALVDHDPSKILGRTRAGTLRLTKESQGLFSTIFPPRTTVATDLRESVRRGDVSGMSFAFSLDEDDWDRWYVADDGTIVREILDMRIADVSIVTYPAYAQTDVQVAQRSLRRFLEISGHTPWRRHLAARRLQLLRAQYGGGTLTASSDVR